MTSPPADESKSTHFTGEHEGSDEDPFASPAFGGYP